MGALAALYKPFDPSLQNVIKYIYLLYIFFCFLLTVPFYPRKKRKQKSREWKRKNQTRCINLAICFYPVALLSIDVFFFHLSLFTCMSFVVVVVKINKNLKKKLPRIQASLSMKRREGETGEKSGRSLMGGRVMEHKYKIFRNEFKRFTLHSWRIKLLII